VLTPRSGPRRKPDLEDVALAGNTAARLCEQIGELPEAFSPKPGAPGSAEPRQPGHIPRPVILTLRREDHSFLLDPIIAAAAVWLAEVTDLVGLPRGPYQGAATSIQGADSGHAAGQVALRPGGR